MAVFPRKEALLVTPPHAHVGVNGWPILGLYREATAEMHSQNTTYVSQIYGSLSGLEGEQRVRLRRIIFEYENGHYHILTKPYRCAHASSPALPRARGKMNSAGRKSETALANTEHGS